jgi:DNA uptake protein ComE-like DNA-binding protein
MSRSLRLSLALVASLAIVAAGVASAAGTTGSADKAAATSTTHKSAHAAHMRHAMPKVDLNTATREELEKLPGIDATLADKIIAARPFKSKTDLTSKGLLTKAQYAKLSSRVTATQTTKS